MHADQRFAGQLTARRALPQLELTRDSDTVLKIGRAAGSRKFQKDYPDWTYKCGMKEIISEIAESLMSRVQGAA